MTQFCQVTPPSGMQQSLIHLQTSCYDIKKPAVNTVYLLKNDHIFFVQTPHKCDGRLQFVGSVVFLIEQRAIFIIFGRFHESMMPTD